MLSSNVELNPNIGTEIVAATESARESVMGFVFEPVATVLLGSMNLDTSG
jgi:hypothetical protein